MDVLVQGALTSATIALVALGFSLVYGVGGIVNLAHGSFFMIGAYSAYAATEAGAPLLVAALVGIGAAMLAGVLLERLVIAPIRHQEVAVLIATLAVAILVRVRGPLLLRRPGAPAARLRPTAASTCSASACSRPACWPAWSRS